MATNLEPSKLSIFEIQKSNEFEPDLEDEEHKYDETVKQNDEEKLEDWVGLLQAGGQIDKIKFEPERG